MESPGTSFAEGETTSTNGAIVDEMDHFDAIHESDFSMNKLGAGDDLPLGAPLEELGDLRTNGNGAKNGDSGNVEKAVEGMDVDHILAEHAEHPSNEEAVREREVMQGEEEAADQEIGEKRVEEEETEMEKEGENEEEEEKEAQEEHGAGEIETAEQNEGEKGAELVEGDEDDKQYDEEEEKEGEEDEEKEPEEEEEREGGEEEKDAENEEKKDAEDEFRDEEEDDQEKDTAADEERETDKEMEDGDGEYEEKEKGGGSSRASASVSESGMEEREVDAEMEDEGQGGNEDVDETEGMETGDVEEEEKGEKTSGNEVEEAEEEEDEEKEGDGDKAKEEGGEREGKEKGGDDPLDIHDVDQSVGQEESGEGEETTPSGVIRVASTLMTDEEDTSSKDEGGEARKCPEGDGSTVAIKAVGDETSTAEPEGEGERGGQELGVSGSSLKEKKKGHSAPGMYTCAWDLKHINPRSPGSITWEALEFCNVDCMEFYQKDHVSTCSHCMTKVFPPALGKYCVRFGADIHQFCSSACLDQFKKGLKICAFCQRDINQSSEAFVAPVGDKGTVFKDFCTQLCMDRYETINLGKKKSQREAPCQVCQSSNAVAAEIVVDDGKVADVCSEPCLQAYKFANKFDLVLCNVCKRHMVKNCLTKEHVNHSGKCETFCSQICANVFIINSRRIVPCARCKVKKYTYDMLENTTGGYFCSCECFRQLEAATAACATNTSPVNSVSHVAPTAPAAPAPTAPLAPPKKETIVCGFCRKTKKHEYTLVDGYTDQFFCSLSCAQRCKQRQKKRSATIYPVSKAPRRAPTLDASSLVPPTLPPPYPAQTPASPSSLAVAYFTPGPVKQFKTRSAQVRWPSVSRSTNTAEEEKTVTKTVSSGCQTDPIQPVFFPVPIPLFVPTPVAMFKTPTPHPIPIPVPVPVPIFLPMKKGDAEGIINELKQIEENIPDDPREYDLLALAAAAAGEEEDGGVHGVSAPGVGMDTGPDDAQEMLEMAMQSASEVVHDAETAAQLEELEEAVNQHALKPNPHQIPRRVTSPSPETWQTQERRRSTGVSPGSAGKKRGRRPGTPRGYNIPPQVDPVAAQASVRAVRATKRGKEDEVGSHGGMPQPAKRDMTKLFPEDPNFKYQLGMFAWDKWAAQRNARIAAEPQIVGGKAAAYIREITSMTPDELVWSLCTFVDEVRKADGSRYQPDVLFYLLIGIQFYFKEIGGRSENFVTSPFAVPFQQKLSEYLQAFDPERMMLERGCIVTRVEEAHLWGARLIGAHSPHVLLFTMMYMTTKFFLLKIPKEHRSLAFPHIMKIWKRPEAGSNQTQRQTILRYAPPPAIKTEQGNRGNLVRELNENSVDRYKCPVKLLEFYVSKIPEHCRHRTNMFYLIPERSTTGESPVWYTSAPCEEDYLEVCLRRILVVREVQQALIDASA